TNVRYLSIQWATNRVSGLDACRQLRDLCLVDFPQKDLAVTRHLANLTRLRIKTGSVKTLDGLEQLTVLDTILIANCRRLTSITSINGLPNLRTLEFESCRKIADFPVLADLPSLEVIRLVNCGPIGQVDFRARLPSLREVQLLGDTRNT